MSCTEETITIATQHLSIAYKDGGYPEKTAEFYTNWSKENNYDQHLNPNLYRGPEIAAQAVADYFPSSTRAGLRILDVAAGTGFVAENLLFLGFDHVDALDPSEGMLKIARQKGLYNHYICSYLDHNKLPLLADTYDCAVTSGGMGEGHIPYDGIDQLIRVVKPGGLVCIVMREAYLEHSQYKNILEPHMDDLEKQGLWTLVSRSIVENYCFDLNGVVYMYKVESGESTTN